MNLNDKRLIQDARPIRLLIADDHALVRQGLRAIFDGTEIEVVAEAENGRQAVELAASLRPDVVILDIRMPEMTGLDALPEIMEQTPGTVVVMFTGHDDPSFLGRAVARRARGYLPKGASPQEILTVVRNVSRRWADELNGVTGPGVRRSLGLLWEAEEGHPLTPIELRVLQHLARGVSNEKIGIAIESSVGRVKRHIGRILEKTGTRGRTELTLWAVREGLV